jgi:hypothetical protein
MFCEVALTLWLLVKGANLQEWNRPSSFGDEAA